MHAQPPKTQTPLSYWKKGFVYCLVLVCGSLKVCHSVQQVNLAASIYCCYLCSYQAPAYSLETAEK